MKAYQANSNNSASQFDWMLNSKYKITFYFLRVQNLNDIKALLIFTEHFLIIKINEERKKTNSFEVIRNMLHPIYCEEENQIFVNYCLIKNFSTQNGLIDIVISDPVNKRNYNLIITNIEKNHLLFSSSLKVEEINKITKTINSKIIAEMKHLIEEFLLMITAFKDVMDRAIIKNGLLEEKMLRALNEAKKYYEKNIKELKKQNQLKNEINKKILKEKIHSKQADKNSISLLSRVEADNYATFEMILTELKSKGILLIEENISLFFEVTSLENKILNLKKVDKSKVSSHLKNINSKNIVERIDDDGTGVNIKADNGNRYLNSNSNANTNKKIFSNCNGDKIKAEDCNNNKYTNVGNTSMAEKYKTHNTGGNKSFGDSARFTRNKENILQTEIRGASINLGRNTEKTELWETPKTPVPQKKNVVSHHKLNVFYSTEKENQKLDDFNSNKNSNNLNKDINAIHLTSKTNENKNTDNSNNLHSHNNNNNRFQNPNANKVFRMDSDTITDVNGLFEDIINQKNPSCQIINNPNSNYDTNNRPATPNLELFLPKNKLEENPAFENYFFENDVETNNENVSSSTKTNSKKEDTDNSKTNDGIKYISNLKELKQASRNIQNALDTPKFCAKNTSNNLKKNNTRLKEIENLNFMQITNKINAIKENHLFLVNNSWSNIFSNASELFCRKYFEFCFEEYFPQVFIIEKDLNGIFRTDSFYSYLFYLRGLKNHLFTDENKIQFSNVFFFD